jgi:hypothetical protein
MFQRTVTAITRFLARVFTPGRRPHKRAQSKLVSSLLVVPLSNEDPFEVAPEDIDEHGVFVQSPRPPLKYGDPVLIRVSTEASEDPLWVKGEVVHVMEGIGFGCRFLGGQDDAKELEQIIKESRLHTELRKRRIRHRTIMVGE